MGGYIVNFMVYTMAMCGLICAALVIYKKIMSGSINSKSASSLKIEEILNINPRKSLLIVKAGDERFLIASDVDKTTLISKLGDEKDCVRVSASEPLNVKNPILNEISFPEISVDNVVPADNQQNRIHLDLIDSKNPDISVMRHRRNSKPLRQNKKNVEIEVGKIDNHGFSTLREMATKVNEL